jgi:benzylsuccinate CoA-transferase BbsF subunit
MASMLFTDLAVLDFCWVGAGAFVTRILADLGAKVIKVESRAHPDNLRLSGPHKTGAKALEGSGYFASRNTGKLSMALNMEHPESRAIALKLAERCSVVTNNFRPGIMSRWGLSYEQVSAVNPSVIYLSMPMQGTSGPHANYIGFGSTIAAISGLVEMSGLPNRAPIGTGTHYPDHVPNPGHALVGLLAALFHRQRTGEGQYVEVAQLESTINLLGPDIVKYSADGNLPKRSGNRRAGSVPCGVFPSDGDDVWVAIEVCDDRDWRTLTEVLGRPAWMMDGKFDTVAGRSAGIDTVEDFLAAETRRFRSDDLVALLQGRGVACSIVANSADVALDPQLDARHYWRQIDHPEMGKITVNMPPFFSVERGRHADPQSPPLLGQHTVEIATTMLGFSEAECARLIKEKTFY